ncbi:hypothetical protein SAMN05216228_100766 [Rhizobium tibeticum]|uniref:Uncharacterized protein n=1 Tax=Rhizobium tibeticum TaxID=501024 RepID=A0A1H8J3Y1_9HYPH|nr:hypothetical protein RTCCBAU85039_2072 [Rhizobium tibeticum]SEN74668.1 hypothetical protein SAMN05216228_100766 [Rhizobium tibeticum]
MTFPWPHCGRRDAVGIARASASSGGVRSVMLFFTTPRAIPVLGFRSAKALSKATPRGLANSGATGCRHAEILCSTVRRGLLEAQAKSTALSFHFANNETWTAASKGRGGRRTHRRSLAATIINPSPVRPLSPSGGCCAAAPRISARPESPHPGRWLRPAVLRARPPQDCVRRG